MKKLEFRWLIAAVLFLGASIPIAMGTGWEKYPDSTTALPFNAVLGDPSNSKNIITSKDNEVLVNSAGNGWQTLWKTRDKTDTILKLLSFPEIPESLFILSKDGIYEMVLATHKTSQIFSTKSRSDETLSFAILSEDPDHWFVTASNILYESYDRGKKWQRLTTFNRKASNSLLFAERHLIAANGEKIFISDNLTDFKTVFSLGATSSTVQSDNFENESDQTALNDEENQLKEIREIISGKIENGFRLWAATDNGVFESRDDGKSWAALSKTGLPVLQISHLVFSSKNSRLFASSAKGVFVYSEPNKRWQEIFSGLDDLHVSGLALITDENETLVAATGSGLMRYNIFPEPAGIVKPQIIIGPEKESRFENWLKVEPSVEELHSAAIRYGDLSHLKIKRWHLASRLQAILPTFSFSKDLSRNSSIDLDRAGTNDPDRYIVGPEDIDKGWHASLSWDIGDFIWSSSQTSIDSRSKIMAEYRYDFLSELSRIYFERRNLQQDLIFNPASTLKEHRERLLRIEELTSLLDGATHGYFSKTIKQRSKKSPELFHLWDFESIAPDALPDPDEADRTQR